MSVPRFHLDAALAPGARVVLPATAARHAARVLRLAPGDALTLFDGRGGEYAARIERITQAEVVVAVAAHCAVERESPLQVTLAQGISSGDRMDYTLQKAVELGVAAIQPIAATRSVVRLAGDRLARRLAHWRGVVTSACEQCGRNRIPEVATPLSLPEWLAQVGSGRLLVLSPLGAARLCELAPPSGMQYLVAGPEGGYDAKELAALAAHGALDVRLGPRVLRTETAALAALAAMQTVWGDF
jgi:16S rRNA (uracil1498-N3)-methyltransferase